MEEMVDDSLYGDVVEAYSNNYGSGTATTTVEGGDDTQNAGNGDDVIYGDVGSVSSYNEGSGTATTTVKGGFDTQNGDDGDD